MKKNRFTLLLALCAILFGCGGCILCGCVLVRPYLNIRNAGAHSITIVRKQPASSINIAPGKSEKIDFDAGLLTITLVDGTYEFDGITVVDSHLSGPYSISVKNAFFGLSSEYDYDLSVMLDTNLELFMLIPGKTNVDQNIPQPPGWPKIGRKISD